MRSLVLTNISPTTHCGSIHTLRLSHEAENNSFDFNVTPACTHAACAISVCVSAKIYNPVYTVNRLRQKVDKEEIRIPADNKKRINLSYFSTAINKASRSPTNLFGLVEAIVNFPLQIFIVFFVSFFFSSAHTSVLLRRTLPRKPTEWNMRYSARWIVLCRRRRSHR